MRNKPKHLHLAEYKHIHTYTDTYIHISHTHDGQGDYDWRANAYTSHYAPFFSLGGSLVADVTCDPAACDAISCELEH